MWRGAAFRVVCPQAAWLSGRAGRRVCRAFQLLLGQFNYGRKGILDPKIAAKIEQLEPQVIKQMREILLAAKNRADAGQLIVLKTY